jgi:hypothetical protein
MLRFVSTQQHPSHAQALVALRHGQSVPDLLRDLYVVQGLSQVEIAARLGVTRQSVAMWLREYGVRRERVA